MEACAVICRKATVALPYANFFSFYAALPSSRAQNRGFCAFLASAPPPFSGISSTKSRFLCAFALQNPYFRAFRAQNRHFCARGAAAAKCSQLLPLRSAAKQLPPRWSRCGTNGSGCPVRLKWLPFGLSAAPYQHSVSFSISGMSEAWYSGSFPALS